MLSVCMATYNGENYLREQLESILPQLEPGDELVISDDSSTDKTLEIISSFADNRIRLSMPVSRIPDTQLAGIGSALASVV